MNRGVEGTDNFDSLQASRRSTAKLATKLERVSWTSNERYIPFSASCVETRLEHGVLYFLFEGKNLVSKGAITMERVLTRFFSTGPRLPIKIQVQSCPFGRNAYKKNIQRVLKKTDF